MSNDHLYIFILKPHKKKRPNYKYEDLLRTHKFYIEYYHLLNNQNPLEVIGKENPKITFPASFTDVAVDFAKELKGETIGVKRIYLNSIKRSFKSPIVGLPRIEEFNRHLIFTLVLSTFRNTSPKINTLRYYISTANQTFISVLVDYTLKVYDDVKDKSDPTWYHKVLRVGRALKLLYGLHR